MPDQNQDQPALLSKEDFLLAAKEAVRGIGLEYDLNHADDDYSVYQEMSDLAGETPSIIAEAHPEGPRLFLFLPQILPESSLR